MDLLLLVPGLFALVFGVVPIIFSLRFRRYVEARKKRTSFYTPPATVVVPCKGIDPGFRENIQSMLFQDYPDHELIFVTATASDPAYVEIQSVLSEANDTSARLVVAGEEPCRAQKLTNMLKAVGEASVATEVIVFLDADVRLRKNFLRHLIAPLQQAEVGATSGYPWYLPLRRRAGSILRSIWGLGALPLLIDDRHNFASGAANAMRKEVFRDGGIAAAMDRAVSDTFAITASVKKLGLRIEFVPECVFASPDDSRLHDTVAWTNRQTVISRVYSPVFWWTVALTYSFATVFLLLGLAAVPVGILQSNLILATSGALMLSLIPLGGVNVSIQLSVLQKLLPEHRGMLQAMRWRYRLLHGLATLMVFGNSVYSLTTDEINWRGIRYKLLSPSETRVLS